MNGDDNLYDEDGVLRYVAGRFRDSSSLSD
jgi:hypothetical protein